MVSGAPEPVSPGPDGGTGRALLLAREFDAIGSRLREHAEVDDVLAELSEVALRLVSHAEHASTSRRDGAGFVTVGATSDLPPEVDQIQYGLGHGPCVDAILSRNLFNAADLRTDPRWPDFGHRAVETSGVLSMLSFRLFFEETAGTNLLAALNLYATKPHAFDEDDEITIMLVGTHGALAISAAQQRRRAEGLTLALQSNREIGAAIGVVMTRLLVTRDQAFDLMRIASQRTNRKLRDVAQDVLDSGTLDIGEPPRRTGD
jgi:GAF domain-containing protein